MHLNKYSTDTRSTLGKYCSVFPILYLYLRNVCLLIIHTHVFSWEIAGGCVNGEADMKNSVDVPHKIKNRSTYDPVIQIWISKTIENRDSNR